MIFLGTLLAIFGLVMLLLRPHLSEENVYEDGKRISRKASPFLLMFKKPISTFLLSSGISFIIIPFLFFWAEPGYQYFLVYPTGKADAIMSQGIKWRGLAKIIPWQKYIDVKVVSEKESTKDIEGVMAPIPIRFIDQVTATVKLSGRFQLPTDKESFISLAIKFRSMENLVLNTLIPTVREQTNNTGYMFAAQDYISGEAQNFRQTLDEQLKDGAYRVNKHEYRDTIYSNIQDNVREIKEVKTAKAAQARIIAEGERDKAAERVAQEKEQVKQLIIAQTDF